MNSHQHHPVGLSVALAESIMNASSIHDSPSSIIIRHHEEFDVAPRNHTPLAPPPTAASVAAAPSRYESQKRRDWNTFGQYLKSLHPPLALSRCNGTQVLEFLQYLDRFGKTKVHAQSCPFFGHPQPPAPCACPLRQAWGSLDALIGRLRAAFEEHGGKPECNPFGARAVRLYLREVRDMQAKARGIAYQKKKRQRPPQPFPTAAGNTVPLPSDHQLAPPSCSTLIPSCN